MSVVFSLLVTGSPTQSQAHLSALRFAKAAIASGHRIAQVFFYQEAVHVANGQIIKPQDEAQLSQRWAELALANQFELQVCVAASNRRGIISHEEAEQNGLSNANIHPSFVVVGLGQLAAAMAADGTRMVHFK